MISKARRRELYQRNKEEHPEIIAKRLKQSADWRKAHPEKRVEYIQRWKEKKGIEQFRKENRARAKKARSTPWGRTYAAIYGRIMRSGNLEKYGNKYACYVGIKNFLTPSDLKMLWERDQAHLLKNPSIDRLDPKGNYTVENCRYLELSENVKRKRWSLGTEWKNVELTQD